MGTSTSPDSLKAVKDKMTLIWRVGRTDLPGLTYTPPSPWPGLPATSD